MADHHPPDLFAGDDGAEELALQIDRSNGHYGRCAIGFGCFRLMVHAFKGHAPFNQVPER